MFATLCRRSVLLFVWYELFSLRGREWKIIAAGLRCRQNLGYENFTSSFGRLRQKLHQKACRTCSTIFPHSTNQIIDLWRRRGRFRRHFANSLVTTTPQSKRAARGARTQEQVRAVLCEKTTKLPHSMLCWHLISTAPTPVQLLYSSPTF